MADAAGTLAGLEAGGKREEVKYSLAKLLALVGGELGGAGAHDGVGW